MNMFKKSDILKLMHESRWDISTKMFEKKKKMKTGSEEIFVAYNSYNVLGPQCSMLSQSPLVVYSEGILELSERTNWRVKYILC